MCQLYRISGSLNLLDGFGRVWACRRIAFSILKPKKKLLILEKGMYYREFYLIYDGSKEGM
jgi:hypothetical protein